MNATAIAQAAAVTTSLEQFLAYSAALIRTYGYLNSADARAQGKESTGRLAWIWATKGRANEVLQNVKLEQEDRWKASDVAAWMKSLGIEKNISDSQYLVDLWTLGLSLQVTENKAGHAASAINAYAKRDEPPPAKSADATATPVAASTTTGSVAGTAKKFYPRSKPAISSLDPENFCGKIGDKISPVVTYIKEHVYVGVYGSSSIHSFEDREGKIIKWFTQKTAANLEIKAGDKFTLSGTVKDYEEFRGTFATIMTRCTVKK